MYVYVYKILSLNLTLVTIPNDLKWKRPAVTRAHDHSGITVKVSELPKGTARLIIGYTRLDLGVPIEGEYVNLQAWQSTTFTSLEPIASAKYRITAWGLGGGVDGHRKRNQSPTVIEVPTLSQGECLKDLQYNIILHRMFPLILLSLIYTLLVLLS